jgi:hypothetical protein
MQNRQVGGEMVGCLAGVTCLVRTSLDAPTLAVLVATESYPFGSVTPFYSPEAVQAWRGPGYLFLW